MHRPPVTGAWRPGDHPGDRLFADLGAFELELGGRLPSVRVAYETWGAFRGDNAVLVLHALTGDSHVEGEPGPGHVTGGWWPGLIGPGAPLDTDRWFVVAPNVLGGCQGTTGPSSPAPDGRPWGSRFPRITIGDQVAVEAALARHLGVTRWSAVIGGSMGGMRALEWAMGRPDQVGAALALATCAAASADQIAIQTAQLLAVTGDPGWAGGDYHDASAGGGPHAGLGLARRMAHVTYRSAAEFDSRFGNAAQDGEDPLSGASPVAGGRFAVQSYLDHHAAKLVRRFDAGSYVALTDAMNTWDVGRGRGGVDKALRAVSVPLLVAGVDSDRLYPLEQQRLIADTADTPGGLRVINSPYGHDAFLLERDVIGGLVRELMMLTPVR